MVLASTTKTVRIKLLPRLELNGERGRNRTFNLLIKSQLLCQLSYAPTVGISREGQTKIIASVFRFRLRRSALIVAKFLERLHKVSPHSQLRSGNTPRRLRLKTAQRAPAHSRFILNVCCLTGSQYFCRLVRDSALSQRFHPGGVAAAMVVNDVTSSDHKPSRLSTRNSATSTH